MADHIGVPEVAKVKARSSSMMSRRTLPVRSRSASFLISYRSTAEGQDRLHSENFVLVAKSAVPRPVAWTEVNTDSTGPPAALCTVSGTRRSSFQVTPWPPAAWAIWRPVTMLVWFGSVTVRS